MHLSRLHSPPPEEPLLHAQDQEENIDPGKPSEYNNAETGNANSSGRENDSSSSDDEDDDDGDAGSMADLLRQNSGSESEEDAADTQDQQQSGVVKKTRPWEAKDDSLVGNIAVLILACWTLRIPLIYRDMTEFVVIIASGSNMQTKSLFSHQFNCDLCASLP